MLSSLDHGVIFTCVKDSGWHMAFSEFPTSTLSTSFQERSLLMSSWGEDGNQHSFVRLAMISTIFSFGSILVCDHTIKKLSFAKFRRRICAEQFILRRPGLQWLAFCHAWPHVHSRLTSLWRGGPFRPQCCTSTLLDFHWAFYCLQTNGRVYFPTPVVNLAWSCTAASGSGEPTLALHRALHFSLNPGK